jgi:hypothetical protein
MLLAGRKMREVINNKDAFGLSFALICDDSGRQKF